VCTSLPKFIFHLCDSSHSNSCEVYSNWGFDWHLSDDKCIVKHFSIYVLAICISFFDKIYLGPLPVFILGYLFSTELRFLYILNINLVLHIYGLQMLSPSRSVYFHFVDCFLGLQKAFISNFIICFYFWYLYFCSQIQKLISKTHVVRLLLFVFFY
jgi:hypothetical protein